MNEKRRNVKNRWFYGLGTVGRDFYYTMVSMYLMFYLTDILELDATTMWYVTGAMILTLSLIHILFLLYLIILLQLVANFIYPKVLGRSIGMPGIWVFTAVIVGAGLGGIGGVLLGVPLTATVYKLLREQVNKRNAANKQASETNGVDSETSQSEESQQETI